VNEEPAWPWRKDVLDPNQAIFTYFLVGDGNGRQKPLQVNGKGRGDSGRFPLQRLIGAGKLKLA
jgi:hypothetical protein